MKKINSMNERKPPRHWIYGCIPRAIYLLLALVGVALCFADGAIFGLPLMAIASMWWAPKVGHSFLWGLLAAVPLLGFAVVFLLALSPRKTTAEPKASSTEQAS